MHNHDSLRIHCPSCGRLLSRVVKRRSEIGRVLYNVKVTHWHFTKTVFIEHFAKQVGKLRRDSSTSALSGQHTTIPKMLSKCENCT